MTLDGDGQFDIPDQYKDTNYLWYMVLQSPAWWYREEYPYGRPEVTSAPEPPLIRISSDRKSIIWKNIALRVPVMDHPDRFITGDSYSPARIIWEVC